MIARWPQHYSLFALSLGLTVGARSGQVALLAAVAAVIWLLQPDRRWASFAVALLLAGSIGGHLRIEASSRQALAPLAPSAVVSGAERVEVLSPPRQQPSGAWSTDVKLRGARVAMQSQLGERTPWWQLGDLLSVPGSLRRLSPGAVGMRARGIELSLDSQSVSVVGRRAGLSGLVDAFRRRASVTLSGGLCDLRSLPPDDPGRARAALLNGMVLGQDDGFSVSQEDAFRRSGLSHLVAASGQNVALLAVLVIAVATAAGARRRTRLWLAFLAVLIYVPLAGSGPSIRRAGVMGAMGLLALILGRPADRWWAFFMSVAITTLVDPHSPSQLGWQLSFATVAGLLTLAPELVKRFETWRVARVPAVALAVPLSAMLTSSPVLAMSVGQVSLTSLPANLLAELVVAPVTLAGMIAAVLGPEAQPVSGLVVKALDLPLDWLNGLARVAAQPGWASVQPGPFLSMLPLATTLALLYWRPFRSAAVRARSDGRLWLPARIADRVESISRLGLGRRSRRMVVWLLLLGAAALASFVAAGGQLTRSKPLRDGVVVLDVGQGSATLLRQAGHSVLIDAGPPDGQIVRRLSEQHVKALDAMFLSHAALDHTGGAPAVATKFRPKLLIDGTDGRNDPNAELARQRVREAGGQVVAAHAGQRLDAGGMRVEVRWPPPASKVSSESDPNERATVVRAVVAGISVLIPADREGPPLRRAAGGSVDVLVLPHHGSADPHLGNLLRWLRPEVAIAQVGAHNGYGHPAAATVEEVSNQGVPLWRSDLNGTVTFTRSAKDGQIVAAAERR